MSIRWLKNVIIDSDKSTIEIQVGDRTIGDKCYTRINQELEVWFTPFNQNRADIIAQGVSILKKRLEGKTVTNPDGTPYEWH
jgi:hypothetical protein